MTVRVQVNGVDVQAVRGSGGASQNVDAINLSNKGIGKAYAVEAIAEMLLWSQASLTSLDLRS